MIIFFVECSVVWLTYAFLLKWVNLFDTSWLFCGWKLGHQKTMNNLVLTPNCTFLNYWGMNNYMLYFCMFQLPCRGWKRRCVEELTSSRRILNPTRHEVQRHTPRTLAWTAADPSEELPEASRRSSSNAPAVMKVTHLLTLTKSHSSKPQTPHLCFVMDNTKLSYAQLISKHNRKQNSFVNIIHLIIQTCWFTVLDYMSFWVISVRTFKIQLG